MSTTALSATTTTTTQPDTGRSSVGSTDVLTDPLRAPPKTSRTVSGGGGYVYEQLSDGAIIIRGAPRSESVGVKLTSGAAWEAITKEIGAFPASSGGDKATATTPPPDGGGDGRTDPNETSFMDTLAGFASSLGQAYDQVSQQVEQGASDIWGWLTSEDQSAEQDAGVDTKTSTQVLEEQAPPQQTATAPGPLTQEQVQAAQAFYATNKNRYPSDLIKVVQEKLKVPQSGKFDAATIQAVGTYQQSNALTTDGQAGSGTIKHMFGSDIRMRADAGDLETVEGGALTNVKSGVVFTAAIKEAWQILQPKLPSSTWMTSGLRTWAKTTELVVQFFNKSREKLIKEGKLTNEEADRLIKEKRYGDMSSYIRKNVDEDGSKMYYVAEAGASNHCTGKALDLSGGSLNTIDSAVKKAAKDDPQFGAVFSKTIVESKQNCVHVDLK